MLFDIYLLVFSFTSALIWVAFYSICSPSEVDLFLVSVTFTESVLSGRKLQKAMVKALGGAAKSFYGSYYTGWLETCIYLLRIERAFAARLASVTSVLCDLRDLSALLAYSFTFVVSPLRRKKSQADIWERIDI